MRHYDKNTPCERSKNEKVKYINENLHIFAIELKFGFSYPVKNEWIDKQLSLIVFCPVIAITQLRWSRGVLY